MPKKNISQLAKFIVDQATGDISTVEPTAKAKAGRLGGVKGGLERAKKLTAEERSKIAKKWRKNGGLVNNLIHFVKQVWRYRNLLFHSVFRFEFSY